MNTQNNLTNQQWLDEMVLDLRLHNVRGAAIGDAVAVVEAHCAESGESAADAFGDPREYARSLDFSAAQRVDTSPGSWLAVLGPIAAGLVATNLVEPIVTALDRRQGVAVTWGWLASLVVLGLVVWLSMKLLPAMLKSRVVTGLWFGLAAAFIATVAIVWRTVAFRTPVWIAATVLVGLLAASVLGMRRQRRELHDPLVDPRGLAPRPQGRAVLIEWLFVIVAAASAVLAVIPLLFRR